jgi:hypothetical protein
VLDIEITANTSTVLQLLRANREAHVLANHDARANWRRQVMEVAEKLTGPIDEKAFMDLRRKIVNLSEPLDYTDKYDEAISLLEHQADRTITLDREAHKQFVQDKWGWKEQWSTSNSTYSG